MGFKAEAFLKQYGFPYDARHKNATKEWLTLPICPFCGSTKWHFGIHETSGACNCWKCGAHGLNETITRLTKASYATVKEIVGYYATGKPEIKELPKRRSEDDIKPCALPYGTKKMCGMHREYLESREYDPDKMEELWGLKGVGIVPGSSFNMRLIAPITHNGIVCSYQGRDVSGKKGRIRYKTCAKPDETRFHKHCLYGLDKVQGDSVVVTEGISKVWRLGIGAVATFGIIWTNQQARLLTDMKNVFILFDRGEQAQEHAQNLAELLSNSVEHVEVVELSDVNDPGDLTQSDANHLMKDLGII